MNEQQKDFIHRLTLFFNDNETQFNDRAEILEQLCDELNEL